MYHLQVDSLAAAVGARNYGDVPLGGGTRRGIIRHEGGGGAELVQGVLPFLHLNTGCCVQHRPHPSQLAGHSTQRQHAWAG